jgi:hypothetical protein
MMGDNGVSPVAVLWLLAKNQSSYFTWPQPQVVIWQCQVRRLQTLNRAHIFGVARVNQWKILFCTVYLYFYSVVHPGIFLSGGGSTNSVEDRGQRKCGSGGSGPIVRGSGGSCNFVQEISFHVVKFS